MFRSLALGSGGTRGGILVGGLVALKNIRGNLVFPDGIYGCSIGSILATAVAFNVPPETIRTMFEEDFQLSAVLPSLRLSHIQDLNKRKGMFPMDNLETVVRTSFAKHGVDLYDKKISDAPQKLFIQATNLTTCRNVWLTGDVPVLRAILCSCCIPLLFQPQVLFNNVYIDGAIMEPFIHKLVPPDCLVLHIERSPESVFPSQIEELSLRDMLIRLFAITRTRSLPSNVVVFRNNTVGILQELSPEDKQTLFQDGSAGVQAFFAQGLA